MQSIELELTAEQSSWLHREAVRHGVSVEEIVKNSITAAQERDNGNVYVMELEDGSVFIKASESADSVPVPSIRPVKLLALLCTQTQESAQQVEQALQQLAEKGSITEFIRNFEYALRLKHEPLQCVDEALIWEQIRAYESMAL